MSLDDFSECPTCGEHTAAKMWMKLYGSMVHALISDVDPTIASMGPGPLVIKVEVCFSCKRFVPSMDYTDQETAEMAEYNKKNLEARKAVESLIRIIKPEKEKEP